MAHDDAAAGSNTRGDEAGEHTLPTATLSADEVELRARRASVFVIGLTGPFGSGCTTAAHMLSTGDPAFTTLKLSDVLRSLTGDSNPSRQALQDLGNSLRRQQGNHALVVRGLGELLSHGAPERLVIDGIRNLGEVRWLQRALGERFSLFAITADTPERYNRRRNTTQSPEEFYELDRRDQGESEDYGQQVNRCVDYADVLIPNGEQLANWQIAPQFGEKVRAYAALVEGRSPIPLVG